MKEKDGKVNILGTMKGLAVGETACFSLDYLSSIRANASLINAIRGEHSLSTKLDRETRTVAVTRIA